MHGISCRCKYIQNTKPTILVVQDAIVAARVVMINNTIQAKSLVSFSETWVILLLGYKSPDEGLRKARLVFTSMRSHVVQ